LDFLVFPLSQMLILTFNGCKGQHCPIKCMYSSPKKETNVLQCVFKLSSALAAAKTFRFKGCMLNANKLCNIQGT